MLIKDVTREFGGRVRYVDHNFGDSELAERFGVEQYPAVFVDDALIARPQDFYLWDETEDGRYTPWKNAESHARFQDDLRRMIELRLRGGEIESLEVSANAVEVSRLPAFEAVGLDGARIESASLAGRLVIVEIWATWCPPCLVTLDWLKRIDRDLGEEVAIVAVATASKEEDVRRRAAASELPFPVVLGEDDLVSKFGNVLAVPTLYVFGRDGRTAGVFYGAPEDLHERVSRLLEDLGAGRLQGSPLPPTTAPRRPRR